jgi:hypothetical protein
MNMLTIIWSGVMFVMALLISPFMFEVLTISNLSGVEGFFARLIPFFVLWYSLIAGSRKFGVAA